MSEFDDLLPGVPLVESPLLKSMIDELQFTPEERRIALDLHDRGYAVFDFPDEQIHERIERIKFHLEPEYGVKFSDPEAIKNSAAHRIQDAWTYDEDVRAVAINPAVLNLLSKLYGRRAFAFQTLNFPVGTQQHLHSDSIHFSSIPERFMCGVWLAMEDIRADAGPLTYLPGSHKWPIISNAMIGRRGQENRGQLAQSPFEAAWEALVDSSSQEPEVFLARKGQALIWAANLLHGGSVQHNPKLTRWSQVTHYYFENCIYYTPAFSDEPLGMLDLRAVFDVATGELKPNLHLGVPIEAANVQEISTRPKIKDRLRIRKGLPADFDSDAYYRLNPDVAAAKVDAGVHYLRHGKTEGRRYRVHEAKRKGI